MSNGAQGSFEDPHHREQLQGFDDTALSSREQVLLVRESALIRREAALQDAERRVAELRDANEHLVFATLAAEELKEAAHERKRQQDEFLAMLAHELRNPLAPIRSAVSIIERLGLNNPQLDQVCSVVRRQVEHMARLLDDLLDASRIASGKVTLQRRPTEIHEFVHQAVEIYLPLIESQHQSLTLDMPQGPLYVEGDPTRLAQMVGNVLHNAAKYTPVNGLITLSARAVDEYIVLKVTDNGQGISQEAIEHVFELFAQEERSLDRSQGGLGVGLTVVRGMAHAHGGTVSVRSDGLGCGSEFTLTLPRIVHEAETGPAPVHTPELAPARILVVDDNLDAGNLLQALLEMSGFEVELAQDGPQALAMFERQNSEIVLCDIGLPKMDGYEVAARIRKATRERVKQPLLIALTGYDAREDRSRALAAGFDEHMAKPVDFDRLMLTIEKAMA